MQKALALNCEIVCTVSSKGAFIKDLNSWSHVQTKEVIPYDTTGAGDFFAAGYLYGLVNNKSKLESGRLGNVFASEIIQHIGCRLSKEKILGLNIK